MLAVLVVEVVVDGEQHPTRAHRVEQPPHRGLAGGLGQRRVLHRHEVERTGRERCLEGVPADPLDGGASRMGSLPRAAYGDLGEVDRSDGPAALSEPDRVGALATTDVERPARGESGDLGDEPPVRSPAPHRPDALAVPRVPLGGLRRRAEVLLAVFVLVHGRDGRPPYVSTETSTDLRVGPLRDGWSRRDAVASCRSRGARPQYSTSVWCNRTWRPTRIDGSGSRRRRAYW